MQPACAPPLAAVPLCVELSSNADANALQTLFLAARNEADTVMDVTACTHC